MIAFEDQAISASVSLSWIEILIMPANCGRNGSWRAQIESMSASQYLLSEGN